VGGSVPVAALIVGTALLGAFALASTALISQTRTAAAIEEALPPTPDFAIDNASANATLLWINISNDGSETLDLDHLWLAEDGARPVPLSDHVSTSEFLFPGETLLVEYAHGGTAPARVSVSAHGVTSAAQVV